MLLNGLASHIQEAGIDDEIKVVILRSFGKKLFVPVLLLLNFRRSIAVGRERIFSTDLRM